MRTLVVFFFSVAPLCASEIQYQFKPVFTGAKPALAVDLRFQGSPSGTTVLRLPSSWAGQKEYYKGIHSLEVATPGAVLETTSDPEEREIKHKPSEMLHVRYLLLQDWDGPLENERSYYRAILQPSYFHLPGEAFLVVPGGDNAKPALISLTWEGLPFSWTLANSFGAGEKVQRLTRSLDELQHAVYVAGDFRLHKTEIHARPVWVAMRGTWKFKDEDFIGEAFKLIAAQRAFWQDDDFPYFLITLIPIGGKCCTTGGSGLTDSFAAFMSPEQELDAQVTHLLSHELFHTWNGQKIDREPPERRVYWFSEGFSDFYTYIISLRTGLITLRDYIAAYNGVLRKYYTSPVKTVPNSRIEADFWTNPAVQNLPYQRGHILAHNWNAKIKRRPGGKTSLDDFMRDFLRAATVSHLRVSSESVGALMKSYLPEGAAEDLQTHIEDGALLAPDAGSLGPCVRLTLRDLSPFELGFDWEKSEPSKIVRGVVKHGAAYDAGLRDGQKLAGASIEWGNPAKEVLLQIIKGSTVRPIKYWPQRKSRSGEKRPLIPEFVLDENLFKKDPASCLRWFGVP